MESAGEKLSTRNLTRLCRENTTHDRVLLVLAEAVPLVPYKSFFPNTYTVSRREKLNPDLLVDLYYTDLNKIGDEEFTCIVCTGLLEHVPYPQRVVDDFYRILKPGGKLVTWAGAVFPCHSAPDDFFRFTPFSFHQLFSQWSDITIRGSSQPFETISILLQRILLQCEVKNIIRPLIHALCFLLPKLDKYISKQYCTAGQKNKETEVDSMMPSNILAVIIK